MFFSFGLKVLRVQPADDSSDTFANEVMIVDA
jgi:hypothetical protein